MGLVTLPSYGADPQTINASNLNGKVDPLATEFNGNIENANIKAGAGIVYSKLTLTDGILNADINSAAAIAFSKLASLTSASILVGNGSNVVTATAVTGDVTISNAGVTAIASGVIVNADISASAVIDFSKLAALTSANILVGNGSNVAASVAVTGDVTISNAGVTAIASGVIVNADVNASAAIDYSKLATLTSANILVGNGSNVATSVAVTGDVTISNAGVTAIASGVIVNADVNASAAIDYSKLATLASARLIVGNGSGVATAVDVTGDVTISNAGVTAIASDIIVNADINSAAAIVDTKLATISTAGKVNFSALVVGSQAQGDVPYASSATVWTRLGAGTNGQFLQTGGAAANPSWVSGAYVAVGSYTGNATDDRSITIGFSNTSITPKAVMLMSDGGAIYYRSSSFTGDQSLRIDVAAAFAADLIQSFAANAFVVGAGAANTNAVVFHFIAWG